MEGYFGEFSDKGDIEREFRLGIGELDDCYVIAAYYSYEDYEGSAHVVFLHDFTLYEVQGGHCSCYGLEGQWKPDVVQVDELRARLERDTGYRHRRYSKDFTEAVLAYLSNPAA